MSQVKTFSTEVAGRELIVEVGKLAKQAHGACTVRYGDTVVLATVVSAPEPREGVDYFPLMVDYEERLYAAGKIKGSRFIKREGKATDEAVLTARLVDRSIRPLFKETTRKDVQVVITVLSVDNSNDPDIMALLAASVALAISPVSWAGPIGGIRVGRINGEWVLNGSYEAREKSDFDLVVAGDENGVIMIEAGGKQVLEKDFSEAIAFGHKHLKKQIAFINDIVKEVGRPKNVEVLDPEAEEVRKMVEQKVHDFLATKDLNQVFKPQKDATKEASKVVRAELEQVLKDDNKVSKEGRAMGMAYFDLALELAARKLVIEKDVRVDGRKIDEIRALNSEVSILPRTHGSGLFTRGETQVLSIVTLGAPGDEQTLDTMEETGKKRYMHHYNFPGFSVGEVKPMRFPSRREVGHGALAEKALEPVLPPRESFPYTIRVVSEVLESNGSSSQASVCGSALALMDAGVPITKPVAGVAMGLITDPNKPENYRILTDIQGIEDHAGDMDFKVAGTEAGITAIQLDIKLGNISLAVVEETLSKARLARLKILENMAGAIKEPRAELSQYAPRIISLTIDPEKIRDVIGSGGKIINEIIAACDVAIDIEDSGLVMITGHGMEGVEKAKAWVEGIVKEFEVGEEIEGDVLRIVSDKNGGGEIGAIVDLGHGRDGMIHISEVNYQRIERVSDYLKEGQRVKVKIVSVDKEKGRVGLSIKALQPRPEGMVDTPFQRNNTHGKPGDKKGGFRKPFKRY